MTTVSQIQKCSLYKTSNSTNMPVPSVYLPREQNKYYLSKTLPVTNQSKIPVALVTQYMSQKLGFMNKFQSYINRNLNVPFT